MYTKQCRQRIGAGKAKIMIGEKANRQNNMVIMGRPSRCRRPLLVHTRWCFFTEGKALALAI